jgi:pyruvate,water dikinase
LTSLGEDIFFLSLDEVLALLSGDQATLRLIPARKEAYQQYKALPPYPSVIRGRFDPLEWAADSQRRSDIFDASLALQIDTSNIITGSPGSAGQVTGSVRVVDDPEQGQQLQPGEILVAVQTDVAWTLLFPRAAAVITDVGAPLSHAAIVARELGIPAVVGCGDATARLKTGDRVRVDGAQGIVEILNDR